MDETSNMKSVKLLFLGFALFLIGFNSCTVEKENVTEHLIPVNLPDFNSDSAYLFVEKQVKFGPRVPNTQSHDNAGDYLVGQLKRYGAIVVEQYFVATTFDSQKLNLRNIIASFHPEARKRMLLAACSLGYSSIRR